MNKENLVKEITNKIDGATKKDVMLVVDTMVDVIKDTVSSGDKVSLYGFGTFEVVERAARTGRNPKTSEEILIPARKAPKFKAAPAFKDAVNE